MRVSEASRHLRREVSLCSGPPQGGTRQLADAWYRLPIFYFSSPLRIFGPEEAVPYPSASDQLDYENVRN
jgi:hypothetical protein